MDLKILIIDDSDEDRQRTIEVLRENGYLDLSDASTAEEGIAKAQWQEPDVVISDVVMPDMGGFEVCQKLRAIEGFKAKIFLITGSMDGVDVKLADESGADRHMPKIDNRNNILEALREIQS